MKINLDSYLQRLPTAEKDENETGVNTLNLS